MRRGKRTTIKEGQATDVFRQFAWNLAGTLAKRPGKAMERKPEVSR